MKLVDMSRPEGLRQGTYKAIGVVLRRREGSAGSADLLLFLNSFGALWVGAPGVSSKNRFGGGIEPMVWGEYDLYQSPKRLYLKGVDVKEDFIGIRTSRKKLTAAVKWCGELARRLPAGVENDKLLSLFWGSMKNLNDEVPAALLDIRLAWRWASVWGVAPTLDMCALCGKALPPSDSGGGTSALLSRDGVLCVMCGGGSGIPVDGEALAALIMVATLPAGSFLSWVRSSAPAIPNASAVAGWLYSFITLI